ncbi:DUF3413 domain-containing protein [Aeromonas diversa]|uniref:Putative alkaline phosphatase superfamily hydrolase n=1 Tax=Aeromonas diversa CDC 2478-85 TaxID=1268237 RepID=N9TZM0_9GAMM|nr:DUF3413 domain-containing protein [Aeromonas diversa]ENY71515.1 putative alkaline phosphatase superfamily hydrolase [Aeromonas diversa CDC 2478-85]
MVETGNPYRDNVSRLITWGHWFCFFNILLAMLIATRYLGAIPWPSTTLGVAYLVVSWIGHFSFLGFITYLLTIFPLSFVLPKEKVLRFSAVLVSTLALLLLLLDTQIFQLFKFHLNGQMWPLLLEQAQTEEGTSWSMLFIAVPSLLLVELLLSAYTWRKINKRKRRQYGNQVGVLLLSCFVLTHLVNSWADATLYQPITAQKANFPLSYPMTARTFLAKHGWLDLAEYEKAAKSQQESEGGERLRYPLRTLSVELPEQRYNLQVVVVDSLRFDMLNNINMPNLQRFADQHQLYRSHLSGGNGALSGLFTLFYGLPGHYMADMGREKRSPLLFDELQRQDYQFGLFGPLKGDPLYRNTLLSGLRKQVFVSDQSDDGALIAQWSQWLGERSGERPWFSLLYLNSVGSYATPAGFQGPFQPTLKQFNPATAYRKEHRQKLENSYKNAVFYVDQLLEQITAGLQQRGMLDNTVVVITADHGLEFNDSGRNNWGYGNNFSPYQVQVPLVIAWPGMQPSVVNRDTSHLDLAPTLMQGMLGVRNAPRDYASGHSLFTPGERPWTLSGDGQEFAIYQGDVITHFDKRGDFELLRRRDYTPLNHANPDMGMLVQVMNELNRFYRQ